MWDSEHVWSSACVFSIAELHLRLAQEVPELPCSAFEVLDLRVISHHQVAPEQHGWRDSIWCVCVCVYWHQKDRSTLRVKEHTLIYLHLTRRSPYTHLINRSLWIFHLYLAVCTYMESIYVLSHYTMHNPYLKLLERLSSSHKIRHNRSWLWMQCVQTSEYKSHAVLFVVHETEHHICCVHAHTDFKWSYLWVGTYIVWTTLLLI